MAATIDPSKLKGMVSEDRMREAELNAQKKEPVREEGTMTEKELALLIEIGYSINKKLEGLDKKLERLVEIFEGVAKEEPKVDTTRAEKPVQVVNKPEVVAPVEKQVAPAPQPSTIEQSPRIKEILEKIEPIKELVTADVDTSAQFVMVRPRTFLGSDNFKTVAGIMKELRGQYVSKGRDSHFLVPKQ